MRWCVPPSNLGARTVSRLNWAYCRDPLWLWLILFRNSLEINKKARAAVDLHTVLLRYSCRGVTRARITPSLSIVLSMYRNCHLNPRIPSTMLLLNLSEIWGVSIIRKYNVMLAYVQWFKCSVSTVSTAQGCADMGERQVPPSVYETSRKLVTQRRFNHLNQSRDVSRLHFHFMQCNPLIVKSVLHGVML